jgi:hypothetical protein
MAVGLEESRLEGAKHSGYIARRNDCRDSNGQQIQDEHGGSYVGLYLSLTRPWRGREGER